MRDRDAPAIRLKRISIVENEKRAVKKNKIVQNFTFLQTNFVKLDWEFCQDSFKIWYQYIAFGPYL